MIHSVKMIARTVLSTWLFVLALLISAQTLPAQMVKPAGQQEKQRVLYDKLSTAIHTIDKQFDGVLGVMVRDLKTGETLSLLPDERFPTASTIKIAVLAELYRQHETGGVKLTNIYTVNKKDLVPGSDIMEGLTDGVTKLTMRDLVTMMITVSDNTATNILIDRLGMQAINKLLETLGCKNTVLQRKMLDLNAAKEGRENLSTPRDMVQLLEKMLNNAVCSKQLTRDMLEVLGYHKESDMARLLPENVRVVSKTGSLEAVRTESGIIFAPDRPVILSIMTCYARDERAAERLISEISLLVHQYCERLGRSSEHGRVISPK